MAVQAGTLEHRNAEQNVEWNKPQEITKKKEALYGSSVGREWRGAPQELMVWEGIFNNAAPFAASTRKSSATTGTSHSSTSCIFFVILANEKYGYTNMRTLNQPMTCLLSLSQSLSYPLQWILHGLIGTINSSPLCLTSFLLGSSNVPTTSHTSLQICSSSFARNTSFTSRLSELLRKQCGTSSRRLGTILLLPSRLLDPVFSSHLPPK